MKTIAPGDENLELRRLVASLSNPFLPNETHCFRCGLHWRIADHHLTWYTETDGCGPLCYTCWDELSPQGRLPFYVMWMAQADVDHETRALIEKAVLDGK